MHDCFRSTKSKDSHSSRKAKRSVYVWYIDQVTGEMYTFLSSAVAYFELYFGEEEGFPDNFFLVVQLGCKI